MAVKELLVLLDNVYDDGLYTEIYENIRKMGGINFISIFKRSGVIRISYDDAAVTSEKILNRIVSFNVSLKDFLVKDESLPLPLIKKDTLSFPKLFFILLLSIIFYYSESFGTNLFVSFILYIAVFAVLSYDLYLKSKQSIKKINIYLISILYIASFLVYKLLLLALSNLVGLALIGWDRFIFFVLIISAGFYLSEYIIAKGRNLKDIESFMPSFVKLKIDGSFKGVAPNEVKEGDIVIFNRGDFVCCDGIVCNDGGEIDESLIKDEGGRVLKSKDDHILAGSFVVDGVLEMRVLNPPYESSFFRSLKALTLSKRSSFQLYSIPLQVSERYISWIGFLIFVSVFLFIKLYMKDVFINAFFIPLFILYPFLIWMIFPLLYLFLTASGSKIGFSIKDIDIVNSVSAADTIVFFSHNSIDRNTILELKRLGLKTILVTNSQVIDKELKSSFDECYLGVNDEEKEGFALKEKILKHKTIGIGRSFNDLVGLTVCDVSIMIMRAPYLFFVPVDVVLLRDDLRLVLRLKDYCDFIITLIKRSSRLVVIFHLFILPLSIIGMILLKGYIIFDAVFILIVLMMLYILFNLTQLYSFRPF